MTGSGPRRQVALECRDLGYPCEWSARTSSSSELLARFADHAKCAHAIDPVPPELAAKVEKATRAFP
jgi:predicted small metal-binding protein